MAYFETGTFVGIHASDGLVHRIIVGVAVLLLDGLVCRGSSPIRHRTCIEKPARVKPLMLERRKWSHCTDQGHRREQPHRTTPCQQV